MNANKVWTYPGDTMVDKLTRAMLTYRQHLQDRDPEACVDIDSMLASDHQVAAKLPTLAPLELDEFMSDRDVAHLVGVSDATVRVWASRGLINRHTAPDGSTRYLVREVMDMYRRRRLRLAGNA